MIETTSDRATWERWCDAAGLHDVFYRWDHLRMWADAWELQILALRYTDPHGTVLLPLLRDDLDALPQGQGRCDLRTAYDFGGPRVFGASDQRSGVFTRFQPVFDELLATLGCVTLFMRLHPFEAAAGPHAKLHAENRVVDLTGGIEAVRARMYGTWRRNWRKACRNGLVTAPEHDPALFSRLYDQTMDKVDAAAWYRFDEATFERMLALRDVGQLVTRTAEGTPIASTLYLTSGSSCFYHLGCSDAAYRDLRPNHHLMEALCQRAVELGSERLHLGGGAPSLLRFKSHLGREAVPYYVVKRVVDPTAYDALCAATGSTPGPFPAYLGWSPTKKAST